MAEETRQKTSHALARTRQLADRSLVDLRLLSDAHCAAGLPYKSLARIQRASRELKELLRELAASAPPSHDGRRE